MRSAGDGNWARGRVPAIVGTLLAIGILYLIVRTALASLSPMMGARLPPADPAPLLRLAVFRSLAEQGRVPDDVARLSQRVAESSPLAFEPFFLLALRAERQGRLDEAIKLMEEARERRANFAPTRLQLATYYGQVGRLPELLTELDIVLRLRPAAIEPAMLEFTKLMSRPGGPSALATALVRQPSWRDEFFAVAKGRAVRPEHALTLLNEVRRLNPRGDHRLERQLFMYALLADGQIRRARSMWLASLPPEERQRHELITNSGFRGTLVEPPFGWSLRSLDVGRAEIMKSGSQPPHLNVDYFGGSNAILAEQALALQPGSYALRFAAQGDAAGSSTLYWNISCAPGGQDLLRIEIDSESAGSRQYQSRFNVPPSGCNGQYIRLVAEAGDVPGPVNIQFSNLEVVR